MDTGATLDGEGEPTGILFGFPLMHEDEWASLENDGLSKLRKTCRISYRLPSVNPLVLDHSEGSSTACGQSEKGWPERLSLMSG